MEKKHGALIFGLLLTAALGAVSLLAAPHIPGNARVAMHFGLNGEANGWMRKTTALAFGPALALALTLVFAIARKLRLQDDDAHAGARAAFDLSEMAALALIAAVHALTLLHAQGLVTDIPGKMMPLAGIVLTVVGNVLSKTQRNTLVGIRTPWSLASAYAWEKSNRMAGRLMVAVGLGVVLIAAAGYAAAAAFLLVGGTLVTAACAAFLSWRYWRTDPTRNQS